MVTLIDRKSKFTLIKKVDSKHAEGVTKATIALLASHQRLRRRVCPGHEAISQTLNVLVYFANPYTSWVHGLNENTNELIRQYFPKGSSFDDITDEEVKMLCTDSITALEKDWIIEHLIRCFLNSQSEKPPDY